MTRAWDKAEDSRLASRASRGLPPRRYHHKHRTISPGRAKMIVKTAQRYLEALRRAGGRARVEIRAGIIFIDNTSYRISQVKAMRKELEARAA